MPLNLLYLSIDVFVSVPLLYLKELDACQNDSVQPRSVEFESRLQRKVPDFRVKELQFITMYILFQRNQSAAGMQLYVISLTLIYCTVLVRVYFALAKS